RHGVDFSDYRGVADCQGSPGIRTRSTTNGRLSLIGCVDNAVLQVDGRSNRRCSERPDYAIADLERAASRLYDGSWPAWAGRRSPNRESRARNQRAVKQRKSMEFVVLIPGGLERNRDGAAVDQQAVDDRCGFISTRYLNSGRWGQYGSAAVGCSQLYRFARRYRDSRRLYKGFITVDFYDAARRSKRNQGSRDGGSISWHFYERFQTSAERGKASVIAAAHFRAKSAMKRSVHGDRGWRVLRKRNTPQNRVDRDFAGRLVGPACDVSAGVFDVTQIANLDQ